MRLLTAWRLPLRIARRDALRHRGRSLLVLFMIALPVLAVTAADVLIQTSQVSGTESVDRRMGSAQALVSVADGGGKVEQQPDPDQCCTQQDYADDAGLPTPSAEQVSSLLDGARLVELRTGSAEVGTDKGGTSAEVTELDLRDEVAPGFVTLERGRLPRDEGEVVINQALADKGYAVGDSLELVTDGAPADPTVVGIAESTLVRDFPYAAGPLGSFGVNAEGATSWLVDGGPVSWATVKQLNEIGATVASREVIADPPPSSERYASMSQVGSGDGTAQILVLVVTMTLLEVVLLAGPAFAVGARKQQRSLALMSATGGTPAQSRRVIVAGAIVLGGAAAVVGVVLGIGVARLLEPLVQSKSITWFGPFELPWLHLLGVACFGLLSAFLAAVVPAYLASRQDVVAVLAGRRGDRPPSLRSPLLGVVLLGIGVGGSVLGALQQSGGEMYIAFSVLPAILGMILLVPLALAGLGTVSGRLPLALRYAVRDANRHRTRTVPAVAAVAATVAGVVTLSIGLSSDQHENQETYIASVADGVGILSTYGEQPRWDALQSALERELPGATVTQQRGFGEFDSYTEIQAPGQQSLIYSSGSALGANVMVSDGPLPVGLTGLSQADRTAAERELAAGGVVVFTSPGVDVQADRATLVVTSYDPDGGGSARPQRASLPAVYLALDRPYSGPAGIASTAAAAELGVTPQVVSLAVSGARVTEDQESEINEVVAGVDQDASLYVERGFRPDETAVIVQLVLIGLGGVLMLGGTLTATFLALSDARPDLATLAAVGASPRTRRTVAAAYAVVVGGVGAVLGAVVGFIPGLAITWPLTSHSGNSCTIDGSGGCIASGIPTGPFIDVPWLMLAALVVALPLLTALVVGAAARARLPLVARLD